MTAERLGRVYFRGDGRAQDGGKNRELGAAERKALVGIRCQRKREEVMRKDDGLKYDE